MAESYEHTMIIQNYIYILKLAEEKTFIFKIVTKTNRLKQNGTFQINHSHSEFHSHLLLHSLINFVQTY